MKKRTLIFFIGMFISVQLNAQSLFPTFVRSYGGTDVEIPMSFILLPDSGYIVSGSTRSFGSSNVNIYIIRINREGDTLWTRVIGNGGESGNRVCLTPNQHLILANSQTLLPGNAANLMKMDLNGNIIWSKAYGGNSVDHIYDVKPTNDNGFIAIGNSTAATSPFSDLFIMKTDSNGLLQWGKHYGGSNYELGMSIVNLSDGGYIAAGSTSSYNGAANNAPDAMLLRIDSSGDTIWAKRYSDAPNSARGFKVLALNDGGFLLTGLLHGSSLGVEDIFLIRTDSLGDTLWTKKYIKPWAEAIGNIIKTKDNGFMIAGQTAGIGATDWDNYLIRTDSLGDTLWTKTLGGNKHDVARDINYIPGGYAILSQSLSFSVTGVGSDYDMVLLFVDTSGNSNCFTTPSDTMVVTNSPFIVANFSPPINNFCMQVSNVPPETTGGIVIDWCNILGIPSELEHNKADIVVYPNPARDYFKVRSDISNPFTFILSNSFGQEIIRKHLSGNNQIETDNLLNGIYFWSAVSGDNKYENGKLIIIK